MTSARHTDDTEHEEDCHGRVMFLFGGAFLWQEMIHDGRGHHGGRRGRGRRSGGERRAIARLVRAIRVRVRAEYLFARPLLAQ